MSFNTHIIGGVGVKMNALSGSNFLESNSVASLKTLVPEAISAFVQVKSSFSINFN